MLNKIKTMLLVAIVIAAGQMVVVSQASAGTPPPPNTTLRHVPCTECVRINHDNDEILFRNNNGTQCEADVSLDLPASPLANMIAAVATRPNGTFWAIAGCTEKHLWWLHNDYKVDLGMHPNGKKALPPKNGGAVYTPNKGVIAILNSCLGLKQTKSRVPAGHKIRRWSKNGAGSVWACPVQVTPEPPQPPHPPQPPEHPPLTPQAECVDRHYDQHGNIVKFTAHFTPWNRTASVINIPVGSSGPNFNRYLVDGHAYHPPEAHATASPYFTFPVGRIEGHVSVTLPAGKEVVWELGVNGQKGHSSLNAWSPVCQPTEPMVCVDSHAGVLRWGYKNQKHFTPLYPKQGPLWVNVFHPAPLDRGQPVRFARGLYQYAFTTEKTVGLTWYLGGRFITASPESTPYCHAQGHSLKKKRLNKDKKRIRRDLKKYLNQARKNQMRELRRENRRNAR